jgi:hypothetical protein
MSFADRIVDPGDTVRLTVTFYQNGVPFTPYSVSDVTIYDAPVGGTAIFTATPESTVTGIYYIDYTVPSSTPNNTFFYDEWTWQASSTLDPQTTRYTFLTTALGSGGAGDIFSSSPSGTNLSIELRIQTLESGYNKISTILTNLATRKQIVQLGGIHQRDTQEIKALIDGIDERVTGLEDA